MKKTKKIQIAKYDYSDITTLIAPFEAPKTSRLIPKKLRKILDKEVAQLKDHFEKHGWNLDKLAILDTILSDYFGFDVIGDIENIISAEAGVVVTGKDYKLDGEYSPVYYDSYKNKIIIIDSPKDKSYIMEHLERDGYYYLGRLWVNLNKGIILP